MLRQPHWILALCFMLACGSAAIAEPLVLAREGKSEAVILIPEKPQRRELLAANDLSLYLRKMTGAVVPVVSLYEPQSLEARQMLRGPILSVGNTNLAAHLARDENWPALEHREAYRVRRSGDVLVIQGNTRSDATHADGAAWGVYAFLEHLGVRWFMPGDLGERYPNLNELVIDDLNLTGQPTMDYRSAFNYGQGDAFLDWSRRTREGGYDILMGHNFNEPDSSPFFGSKALAQEHPDWFFPKDDWLAICLSHPQVRARFAEFAIRFFDEHPTHYTYSLTPYDTPMPRCPCSRCTPLEDISMSDMVVDFYSAVADEVAKKHPDKFCSALAYINYLEPPKQVKVSPHFIPVLAPLGTPELSEKFDEIVRGWKALAPRVYLYSYDMGLPAQPQRVARQFASYKRWQLSGMMVERRHCWAISGLNYWMEQRLMWDWDADPAALVDEFCNGVFGPEAGPVMKAFFQAVEHGAPWSERQALLDRAAEAVADQPDSPQAQCVHVFDLGEKLLSTRALMEEAARREDWQTAADQAAQGVAAFRELEKNYGTYYHDSGDIYGSYQAKAVEMEPIYRARAAEKRPAEGSAMPPPPSLGNP